MRPLYFSFVLTLSLAMHPSWAGKVWGNPSHVVVRPDQESVQLLDFYEAEREHKLRLAPLPGRTYEEIAERAVTRIEGRFPSLARVIREGVRDFRDNSEAVDTVPELEAFEGPLPQGWTIRTMTMQRDPLSGKQKKYHYLKMFREGDLPRMDEYNFAGNAVHEGVLSYGLKNGARQPLGARRLTGLVFSESASLETDEDWITALLLARVDAFDVAGVRVPLFSGDFGGCVNVGLVDECQNVRLPPPARMTFTKSRLHAVIYEAPQAIDLSRPGGPTVTMYTERVVVDRGAKGDGLQLLGAVEVGTRRVGFHGVFNPATGRLCGKRVRYDITTHPRTTDAYCGPAANVVDDLTVQHSEYRPK